MPFGGSQIPQGELDIVRNWIAAGAECMATPVDPGDDAPAIASIVADNPAPVTGGTVKITVTLTKAAPETGQVVMLAMDTNAISAPVQVVIPAAATVARFEA